MTQVKILRFTLIKLLGLSIYTRFVWVCVLAFSIVCLTKSGYLYLNIGNLFSLKATNLAINEQAIMPQTRSYVASAKFWLLSAAHFRDSASQSHIRLIEILQLVKNYESTTQGWSADHPSIEYMLHRGDIIEKVGDLQGAEKIYQLILMIQHDNSDAYCRLANIYQKQGNLENSLKYYKLSLNYKNFVTLNRWEKLYCYLIPGDIYLEKGNLLLAQTLYQESLAIVPNNTHAYIKLGDIHLKLNELSTARAYLSQAIQLTETSNNVSDNIWAYLLMGNSYLYQNDFDQAVLWFEKANLLYPTSELPSLLLGQTYYHQGLYMSAVEEFQKAIRNNNSEQSHLWLGKTFYELNRPELALIEYKKVILLNPKNSEASSQIRLLEK